MSVEHNTCTEDFSKYDSMTMEELEEILRADAMGPERDDSDIEEILYVMEVLAKKRRQNGIAGKTALEAYQEFQQNYLPMVEEESNPGRKSHAIPFLRITAVAASLILVFSMATTANALSFREMWDAVVVWAQETFSFSAGVEVSEPNTTDSFEYTSFQDVLAGNGRDSTIIPQWVPDQYDLINVIVDKNPVQESYIAIYSDGDEYLKISVISYLFERPEQFEVSAEIIETYSTLNTTYYFLDNNGSTKVLWITDSFECSIVGKLNVEELKQMIDSIQKG